jgi:Na+/melibiose symporter-like transporter
MLFDGLNTLVLPNRLLGFIGQARGATALGLITFVGLVAGMLVQPLAGLFSDRTRPRWGRRGAIGVGVVLILASLAYFGRSGSVIGIFTSYVMIQVAASVAQAAQQGFIPDLVATERRGTAAGLKGFMDVGGAMLGFVVLGQLLGEGQTSLALLAIAAVTVVTFLLTVLLVREPTRPGTATPRRATPVDAFRLDLRRHRAFAVLVLSRFLFLLGTYAVGRFFLFFVASRLGLDPARAAEEAGALLAGLAFVTVLAALPAGWAADRIGRMPLMVAGAGLSALGVLLLILARSALHIFLFGGLMAIGSAAFAGANWALTADLAPPTEAARFLALANIGTAGAAAAAGLFGPVVDWANGTVPGGGYTTLFVAAAVAFLASAVVLRGMVVPGRRAVVHQGRIG